MLKHQAHLGLKQVRSGAARSAQQQPQQQAVILHALTLTPHPGVLQARTRHPNTSRVGLPSCCCVQIAALMAEGKLKVTIDQVLPLAQAAKAQEISEAGHVRGKLVLAVADL